MAKSMLQESVSMLPKITCGSVPLWNWNPTFPAEANTSMSLKLEVVELTVTVSPSNVGSEQPERVAVTGVNVTFHWPRRSLRIRPQSWFTMMVSPWLSWQAVPIRRSGRKPIHRLRRIRRPPFAVTGLSPQGLRGWRAEPVPILTQPYTADRGGGPLPAGEAPGAAVPMGRDQSRTGALAADSPGRAERTAGREDRSQVQFSQPQRVGDDRDGAEAHGGAGDHRAEEEAEDGIERAAGDGNSEGVVEEGENEVLPDVPHRGAAELARADDPPEVPLHQRHAGALHRHVGAGSHGDAHLGPGQRRSVVDTVAGHGHHRPFRLQA